MDVREALHAGRARAQALNGRAKGHVIGVMLRLHGEQLGDRIANAIEAGAGVGKPAQLQSSEHRALVDEIRRDQATIDARLARKIGGTR
jgi:hypothetical protein